MRFEWDPAKDRTNRLKRGLSFAEAAQLFAGDVDILEIYEKAHSGDEDRFIAVGPIQRGVIVVAFTERQDDDSHSQCPEGDGQGATIPKRILARTT